MFRKIIEKICLFVKNELNPFETCEYEMSEEERRTREILERVLPQLYIHELKTICNNLGIRNSYLDTKEELVAKIMNYIDDY